MKEHSNMYRIFQKDQQAHPMAMERVIQVLKAIMERYAEKLDTS